MIYSKEKGWYFIHVPKNAGSSILKPFVPIGGKFKQVKETQHEDWLANRDKYNVKNIQASEHTSHNKASYWGERDGKGLTPIAILRNPWSRCLSQYLFNVKISAIHLNQEWGAIDHPILVRSGFKECWMPGGFFVDGHASHVEYNKETERAWATDDPQYTWLEGYEGKWFRLEDGFDDFCKFTGLPLPPKVNTTQKTDYRKYYDDELAERIGTLYAKDVELGGYSF